ncbi:MAG: chemotaxis-specific protein-glutamate methyltransferase CheB [Gemmatimonadaceae bacterium]
MLVVDDSAFMRKLIGDLISAQPDFTVIGFARDGMDALAKIAALDPDIITLDLEMPNLDGMRTLERIMADAPRPVIVLSAGGEQFGDATVRALELGAIDFVKKPAGPISLELGAAAGQLKDALNAAARATRPVARSAPARQPAEYASGGSYVPGSLARRLVVIAASTGGPRALAEIIPALPRQLGAAVVIAQHLPREFTRALAERLDKTSSMHVCLAAERDMLRAGSVYVAAGGVDTVIDGAGGSAAFSCVESTSASAPSADVLFSSAAHVFGPDVIGVVLTGMGRDGAEGLDAIRRAGGHAIVQDKESSAIYGMPRAALMHAGADQIVSLSDVASAITGRVPRERVEWLTA